MVNNYKRAAQGESGLSSLKKGDTESRGKVDDRYADTQSPAATEASWDPYQVWLTRVKQPRDQSARRASRPGAVEPAKSSDLSETARLRTLSAAAHR